MQKTTYIAKITRPRVTGVLPRERLFRLLDNDGRKQVIWLAAPAGAGKTTVVASWLDARKLPCLWYRVDEGDADPAGFFYHVGLAAKKAAPRSRKPLPFFTPEYLIGISTFTRRYFEKLFKRLIPPATSMNRSRESSKPKFIFVFDNYQDVPDDCGFHEIMRDALSVVPEGIYCVVISRGEPPPTLARMKVNGRMSRIEWDDTRFTDGEIKALFTANARKPLSDEVVKRLHEKTEGWVAGLVLLMEKLKGADADLEFPDRITHEELFEYFAEEVFRRADNKIQDFLLRTSLLPIITLPAAEKLTAAPNADKILKALCRNHFFITRHASQESMYQYHPLFREFLLSRASGAFSEDEVKDLLKRAGALLEESGQVEYAAELYRDAGDWLSIAELIIKQARMLITEGRYKTLESWLKSVPDEVLNRSPWLVFWYGACRLAFDPGEALRHYEKAFKLFQGGAESEGTLLAWSGAVNAVLLGWNDFAPLDSLIAWFTERADKLVFPSIEVEAECASSMAGALVWRKPDHHDMKLWVERALNATRKTENPALKMQACIHASYYYLWVGDIPNALLVNKELGEMSRKPDVSPLTFITFKWLQADTSYLTGASHESGLKAVSEALQTAHDHDIHVWDHMMYALGAYGSLLKEDLESASEFLGKMKSTLRADRSHGYCHYHYIASWYNVLAGDISGALSHAELSLKLALEIRGSGLYFPEILCRLALANILCERKNYLEALDHLALADDLIMRSRSRIMDFMSPLTSARIALAQADEEKAMDMLRSALELGRRNNFLNMLYWRQPSVMSALCLRALEAGIETEYVKSLIRTQKLKPREGCFPEAWPWPVKIYALGRFEIEKDGERIVFSGKVQQKPLSMLKAIMAFGGEGVREGRLIDVLWPEAEGDVASLSFRTTLHRLRQLLGNENAIQFKDGGAAFNPQYCWVDVLAFLRTADEVEKSWKELEGNYGRDNDRIKKLLELSETVLSLYKGDFLPDDYRHPCTFSIRERLKNTFVRIVGTLGKYYEGAGQWEKVIEWYENALAIDELQEEFYRRLMRCYLEAGRNAEALAVYDRCRKILASVLRIQPSGETEALLKNVKRIR